MGVGRSARGKAAGGDGGEIDDVGEAAEGAEEEKGEGDDGGEGEDAGDAHEPVADLGGELAIEESCGCSKGGGSGKHYCEGGAAPGGGRAAEPFAGELGEDELGHADDGHGDDAEADDVTDGVEGGDLDGSGFEEGLDRVGDQEEAGEGAPGHGGLEGEGEGL